MTITIKIPCKTSDNAVIIGKVAAQLAGMAFHIDVEAEVPSKVADKPLTPSPASLTEAKTGEKDTPQGPKFQALGEIKRKVLAAHASQSSRFHSRDSIGRATGLTKDQVRSAVSDGLNRKELVAESSKIGADTRITEHGQARLKSDKEKENSQAAHVAA